MYQSKRLSRFVSDVQDIYNDAVDNYNGVIRSVQGYFANRPFESQQDYEIQSFLYQVGFPRKNNELYAYMDRYGLSWSDLNTDKTLRMYSDRSNSVRSYMFVSKNLDKLYR